MHLMHEPTASLCIGAGKLRAGRAEGKACRIAGFLGSKPHSRERGGKEEWGQLAASAADVYNVY